MRVKAFLALLETDTEQLDEVKLQEYRSSFGLCYKFDKFTETEEFCQSISEMIWRVFAI
jgi:hypothetical protein